MCARAVSYATPAALAIERMERLESARRRRSILARLASGRAALGLDQEPIRRRQVPDPIVHGGAHACLLLASEAGQVEERAARRSLAAAGGEEGVGHGVLDVAVTEPVLDEAQVGAGLEQVGGDGVLQAVEVPLGRRQVGHGT